MYFSKPLNKKMLREQGNTPALTVKKCWKRREFTSKLPTNYDNIPSYTTVRDSLSNGKKLRLSVILLTHTIESQNTINT